jgi:hypothetical protein
VDEWKPKGLTQILADALLAVHSGASLYGIESRLSRLEKMGLVVYRRQKWRLTVHGAEVANKLAEDDLLYTTPQPSTTKPIAAVKGWFHGECVIQALDPEAVLPAGMALYSASQPVVPVKHIVIDSSLLIALLSTSHPDGTFKFDYRGISKETLQDVFEKALLIAGKENNNE